jgi:hypothetical protein
VTRTGKTITSEQRQPGIEVFVTLRRSMGPWLLETPEKKTPSRDTIELKETGK